jgi:hypothetical protein
LIRRLLREPLRRFLVVVGGCADLKSNLVAGSSLIDIGDPTIDSVNFDASYLFRLGEDRRHLVRPMVRYTLDERDGEAISGDACRLQLSYIFLGQGYSVASIVAFGSSSCLTGRRQRAVGRGRLRRRVPRQRTPDDQRRRDVSVRRAVMRCRYGAGVAVSATASQISSGPILQQASARRLALAC